MVSHNSPDLAKKFHKIWANQDWDHSFQLGLGFTIFNFTWDRPWVSLGLKPKVKQGRALFNKGNFRGVKNSQNWTPFHRFQSKRNFGAPNLGKASQGIGTFGNFPKPNFRPLWVPPILSKSHLGGQKVNRGFSPLGPHSGVNWLTTRVGRRLNSRGPPRGSKSKDNGDFPLFYIKRGEVGGPLNGGQKSLGPSPMGSRDSGNSRCGARWDEISWGGAQKRRSTR